MEESMFTTLLTLPLFQGLSYDDATRIVESTRLDFITLKEGNVLCRHDEPCNDVYFIIEGRITTRTPATDGRWAVEEQVQDHSVIGLNVLYGRRRTHPSTCTALTTTRIMVVDKRTMGALFRYFEVMQLGAFNILTSELAERSRRLWLPPTQTLEQRIIRFMLNHVNRPAGPKRFEISMAVLGLYLGEDQRRISRALHTLERENLLVLQRRAIEVPAFELLLKRP
jgi:CRP-like cAMP-binding protein